MLLVVLLLADDDGPVDEDVVEQEKLSRLKFFPACLREYSLANEDASGDAQGLSCGRGQKSYLFPHVVH
jgi:hypothetical protein